MVRTLFLRTSQTNYSLRDMFVRKQELLLNCKNHNQHTHSFHSSPPPLRTPLNSSSNQLSTLPQTLEPDRTTHKSRTRTMHHSGARPPTRAIPACSSQQRGDTTKRKKFQVVREQLDSISCCNNMDVTWCATLMRLGQRRASARRLSCTWLMRPGNQIVAGASTRWRQLCCVPLIRNASALAH